VPSALDLLTGQRRTGGLQAALRDPGQAASPGAASDGGIVRTPAPQQAAPFAGGINGPIQTPISLNPATRTGPFNAAPTAGPSAGAQPTGDPVLDAALANLAEQERRAQANFQASQGQINSTLDPGLADIGKQYQRNSRSLLATQEGRGVLRSGETDTRIADLTSDRVSTEASLRKSIADQLSQANLDLTDKMGTIAGGRTTALGDAAARKAQKEAQQAAEQRAFEQQQAQQAAQQAFAQQEAEKQRQWETDQASAQEAEREREFQVQMQQQQAAQQQAQQQAQQASSQQAADNAVDPESGLTVGQRRLLEATNPGLLNIIISANHPQVTLSPAAIADRRNPLDYTAGGRVIRAS
jgi:hypothetical protein